MVPEYISVGYMYTTYVYYRNADTNYKYWVAFLKLKSSMPFLNVDVSVKIKVSDIQNNAKPCLMPFQTLNFGL